MIKIHANELLLQFSNSFPLLIITVLVVSNFSATNTLVDYDVPLQDVSFLYG